MRARPGALLATPVAQGIAFLGLGLEAAGAVAAAAVWARGPLGGIDFRAYRVAAQIGLHRGWAHVYDLSAQRPQLEPYFAADHRFPPGYWAPFVTGPPAAWLVAPLAGLDFNQAWAIWSVLTIACVVASAWLFASNSWRARMLMLLLLLATTIGFAAGNIVALVLLALAAAGRLAPEHPGWAGIVLSALILKPQVVLLVIPALLVAGLWRVGVAALVGAALLALVSLATLGRTGIANYVALLRLVGGFSAQAQLSLLHSVRPGWLAVMVAIAAVLVTLGMAWLSAARGPAVVIAIALVGSFLIAPYLNGEDFLLLGAAGGVLAITAGSELERVCAVLLAGSSTIIATGTVGPPALAAAAVLVVGVLGRRRDLRLRLSGPTWTLGYRSSR